MLQTVLTKKNLGIPLSLIIVLVGWFLPPVEGLSHDGAVSLAVLFAAVALWLCESLPMGVTGLLVLVLAAILDITEISTVFSGFASTTFIFAMTVFSLTAAMMKSDLSVRLTGLMAKLSGPNSKKFIFVFMISGWLLSSIMNDIAAIVLFLGFADAILKVVGHRKGESHLAKCLYIGGAFAIYLGGTATPAGSAINVLILGLIEQGTELSVSFLDWIVVLAPVSLVMVPLAWFVIIKMFKPEPLTQKHVDALIKDSSSLGKLKAEERKTLMVLIGLPVFWVLGSWFPIFNVATVSVFGLALMCAPGFRILTFEEYQKAVPWSLVIMIGSVISFGAIIDTTGGVEYLATFFLNSGVMELGMLFMFWLIVAAVYFAHTFMPVGHAFATVLIPPLMTYCAALGHSPAIPALLLAAILSNNFILPINPGLALTYRNNVYTIGELAKTGIIPVLCFITLLAAWVPFIVGVLGIPN